MSARRRSKKPPRETWPVVIETFGNPTWRLNDLAGSSFKEPSAFNGDVRVTRFRITVEPIAEPPEVIAERLRALWRKCDNYHLWYPLEQAAARHGVELDPKERGKDAKPRW